MDDHVSRNVCLPNKLWQEIAAASLHDQTSPGKDETDLGSLVCDPYAHWQRHSDPYTYSTALYCSNGWLPTLVDGKDDPSTAIPVVSVGFFASDKTSLQISSSAEHLAVASNDNTLDPVVDIKKLVSSLHISHEGGREGIVVVWSVQCQENHRRDLFRRRWDMGQAYLLEWKVGI